MISKRYDFDEDTVSKIKTIKQAKDIKTEKEVLIRALDHYLLSEMIEHESIEFKTLQKMNEIQDDIQRLNSKMNHIDHGVSVNSLLLTADFEIQKHPKAIVNRGMFESDYYTSARKEITKMIREKDSYNRKNNTKKNYQTTKEVEDRETKLKKKFVDDDWLDV